MELETLFSNVILRFSFNLLVAFVIIKLIYHRDYKGNDFVFTYFMFNTLIFFFAYILGNLDINMAFGFGLFAVFAILRYRTDPIPIKEMTYLFIVIGISVINALANKKMSYAELLLTNSVIIFATYGMERLWLLKHESRKVITYEKIELIVPENHTKLKEDLERRTGLKITRFEIGKINFLNDTAQIFIHYYADEQDGKFKDEGLRSE